MKRIIKYLFISFLFIVTLTLFKSVDISAKVSTSSVFEVIVGEEKLPLHYTLEETNEGVKEKIQFTIKLKGLSDTSNSYSWEHTFCYALNGGEEVCEVDITGSNQENSTSILSNQSYNYYYYDEDMPYYSEDLVFDYIKFKNKFTCLDCIGESQTIILDDIVFNLDEINYKYTYDMSVNYLTFNNNQYVTGYTRAVFVNNESSSLKLSDAPI